MEAIAGSIVLLMFASKAWSQSPSIDSLSASSGDAGTSITITGINFGQIAVSLRRRRCGILH